MSVLEDGEIEKVIMALAEGQPQFSEDDAAKVVEWAEMVRVEMAILDNVLKGKLVMSVIDGDVAWCTPKEKQP